MNQQPSVPSTCRIIGHSSNRNVEGREGAKNTYVEPDCHTTIYLGTYNERSLIHNKLCELEKINDVTGLNQIRRVTEVYIVQTSGKRLCM